MPPSTGGWDGKAMIASVILAAALAGAPPAPDPRVGTGPTLRIEHGRIVRVSPRPPDSGIFAAYADFDVALPGRAPQTMYLLWMSRNQFLPEAGSVCTIIYRREALLPGNLHRPPGHGQPDRAPYNVVYELNCGFAPGTPPPVQRNPSA
jgi:hypothetical protein